jgi:hypothetical protein
MQWKRLVLALDARALVRIPKKTSDRHRAYAPWDWSNGTGTNHSFRESDVADEFGVSAWTYNPVDSDVNHRSSRLNPISSDELWSAGGHEEEIGVLADRT